MIITRRADEILPGTVIDTQCGIGDLAFVTVTSRRMIENDNPGSQDRVELRWDDGSISPCRELLADYPVRVKV